MRHKGSRKRGVAWEQEVFLARERRTRLRGEGCAGGRTVFGAEMSRNCREGCLNKDSLDVALQFEMEIRPF